MTNARSAIRSGQGIRRVGTPPVTSLLAGEPVHVVAARLGHADPSVTLRVYAHVIQDLTPAVADAFAQAVRDAGQAAQRGAGGTGVSKTVSTEVDS